MSDNQSQFLPRNDNKIHKNGSYNCKHFIVMLFIFCVAAVTFRSTFAYQSAPLWNIIANHSQTNIHYINKHILHNNTTSSIYPLLSSLNSPIDTPNTSKWINCFKNISYSLINLYNQTQYELNKLIKQYLSTNKLKIFIPTYMRMPNLYEYKCGLPMTSFHISDNYYYIENEFYMRNFDRMPCTKTEFCLPFDWIFLWKYIIKHYQSNGLQWLLFLEDDISLCPNILNAIFYYMNDTLNTKYKFISLSSGFTATLINIDLLQTMIDIIYNFPYKMARKYKRSRHKKWTCPVIYLHEKLNDLHLRLKVNKSLIYHPSKIETPSTMNHSWAGTTYCGKDLNNNKNKRKK
eukprot:444333_1